MVKLILIKLKQAFQAIFQITGDSFEASKG